ncbi:Thiol peroxidase, Bcp-type [Minicystis rosea]|nr:Thiol peroxidase, Bcp-type [Minicystis rosea]
MLKVGDPAPPIDAIASNGNRFVLDEQPGLCTVIYFFPKAFTPGCTAETKSFRKNYVELDLASASVVGISTDEPQTQCRFADSLGVPFPIIGDEDRSISRAYDVLWPLVGLAQRVTYVVGPRPDGPPGRVVEAVFHHELRVSAHTDDVLRFVDAKLRASRPQG